MLGKLTLLLKSKLAVAALGTILVAGGGTAVALASTGAHVPLVSQAQTSQSNDNDASDDHGNAQGNSQNDGQQVEGAIKSIDAGHSSFVLTPAQGAAVTVVVNAQTVFEEGLGGFSDLKVGLQIEAKGTRQADGSLLATKIEGQNENANENEAQDENELKGTIGSINAANSTFVLQLAGGATKTVQVSAQTEFDGGFHSFADLKAGMSVEVRGNLQADGTLAATRVQSEDAHSGDDHGGSGSGSNDGGGR
jgi:hypothetical protein